MLEWKFNGKTIPANRIGDELAKAFRAEALRKAKQAIAGIRCPVHGGGARNIIMRSAGGDRLTFEFEACCDGLKKAIAAKLR